MVRAPAGPGALPGGSVVPAGPVVRLHGAREATALLRLPAVRVAPPVRLYGGPVAAAPRLAVRRAALPVRLPPVVSPRLLLVRLRLILSPGCRVVRLPPGQAILAPVVRRPPGQAILAPVVRRPLTALRRGLPVRLYGGPAGTAVLRLVVPRILVPRVLVPRVLLVVRLFRRPVVASREPDGACR
ncbi:hypothetical protein [Streptomyces lycii]|uniref:Uncharacterized protein n=1 Tax=Streptomyces lycii TaxID=2654337 RepID=A0ABQ7FRP6_9ACTN|nr:hypothetical protein [Streptomyces lycii]KAF4410646.1 hypothetical protein GCU69_02765 [Streptomyces lycii]